MTVALWFEFVQFASRTFLQDLLHLYNAVLNTGNVPCTWNKTIFIMLAKFKNAKLPSDSRPIASVRILYKVFTYMVLVRIEPVLEASQPEEQHGFFVAVAWRSILSLQTL